MPPPKPRRKIALVASVAWTLWNYRRSLIQHLENAGYEVILMAADDGASTHLAPGFVPLRQLSRKSLSPFQNLWALIEMYRLFRRHQPDTIFLFTVRPNTLGNIAAAALGIPTISTIEGMGISGTGKSWLRSLTRTLYRIAFRHAHQVIFLNTDDLQEFVSHQLLPKEKACLVPGPGIDLQYFAPMPPPQPPEGKTVFLFMGRLLSEKGIREFVAAARQLRTIHPEMECQILGQPDEGNPTAIPEKELQAWIAEGCVRYLGFRDDVRPAIAAADVLVLPSYYREGVPRSILEAMGMGKMVITTDNVGCRETVEAGKNGYLVPVRNVPALVEAMLQAAALSPAQRREMGQYGRQKAEREFADDQVIPLYLQLIQQVLPAQW